MVQITDLALKDNNLIAATQGRSFWMIDDLTPLHQLNDAVASSDQHLFQPMASYRLGGYQGRPSLTAGTNHPGGVMIHYYLDEVPDTTVMLEILEADGDLIARYTTAPDPESDDGPVSRSRKTGGLYPKRPIAVNGNRRRPFRRGAFRTLRLAWNFVGRGFGFWLAKGRSCGNSEVRQWNAV